MYAIVVSGGKQYKVTVGQLLKVELINNKEIGDTVKLDVLMVNNDGNVLVGSDLKNAYANAEIVYNGKGPKLNIFTYKPKKNIRKRQGHRQPYTQLKITEIIN